MKEVIDAVITHIDIMTKQKETLKAQHREYKEEVETGHMIVLGEIAWLVQLKQKLEEYRDGVHGQILLDELERQILDAHTPDNELYWFGYLSGLCDSFDNQIDLKGRERAREMIDKYGLGE